MLLACSRLDAIIQTIRAAPTSVEAKQQLQTPAFGLSVDQAEAILSMQLRRLTALEQDRLEAEAADLEADVARLSALLSERANVEIYISTELAELKAAHATPRLSSIELEYEELSDMDLTPQEACVIVQVAGPPA
jgi:DNA gyrase subunit A